MTPSSMQIGKYGIWISQFWKFYKNWEKVAKISENFEKKWYQVILGQNLAQKWANWYNFSFES